eukprot:TRINITY_DN714_c0_g1_i1.p1 TRINITY_DN714_c0_g1~~TRINITY_DN714_c0_g1_i1.p1  ORF type:complete len:807 (-),score=120.10 TRINITY_DN714_c0_g1_i1:3888-6188(-)
MASGAQTTSASSGHAARAGASRSASSQRGRSGAPRKMRIRAYDRKPSAPPQLFNHAWNTYLRPAVDAVHQSRPVPFSLEELYGHVHDVVLHRHAPALYDALRDACDRHIAAGISVLAAVRASESAFLEAVLAEWDSFCTHMLRIRQIFLYLDRTYIVQTAHPQSRSFWDMGLLLFRTHFSNAPNLQTHTVNCLLSLINSERDGDSVDVSLIRNLLLMFSAIGTYDQAFEKPFLGDTDAYYRNESRNLVASRDVPAYLKHAEHRIFDESQRALRTLDPRTRNPLISTVEKRLVSDHVLPLLDNGFSSMCDDHRRDDLKRCYVVLSRASDHMPPDSDSPNELMKSRLIDYVKKVGRAIVMDKSKDPEMVQSLLDLKERLDDLVNYSFDGTEAFNIAINFAFESFVNARENKPAELIAKFVDGILRTGNKGFSEEQLESTLDKALTLFRFIDGKDVFEAFYNKDLAKRLLYDKSASLDLEKSMISKLKQECGPQFTSKLEAMFRDVDASKDLMQSFRTHKVSKTKLPYGVELNVFVLEAARWPLSTQPSNVKLPQSLKDCQEVFKNFYLTKHSGRKLAWQHVDGSCTVKARFPEGIKILQLSLYQTIVMVLFNDADEISYLDIAEATGIDEQPLKRTLLSLACGKARVLQKRPKGPRVASTDSFLFNKKFTHRLTKLKINAIQMKETVEENAATTEKVFQERNYQIDAAVVRIMKTRRTLQHTAMLSEIYNQLRFPHKPGDVKKRIESLIEREYLERDENNPQTYHYLA